MRDPFPEPEINHEKLLWIGKAVFIFFCITRTRRFGVLEWILSWFLTLR